MTNRATRKAIARAAALALLLQAPFAAYAGANARLQVVHASPDAPAVDVLADGTAILTNFSFPSATPTIDVPAGTYDVDVVPTGGGVGDSVLALPRTALDAGVEYVVTAFRPLRTIAPIVYTRTTTAPSAGNIRVRAVHAADGVGEVDILAITGGQQGAPLFQDLAEGGFTSETELPAGAYRVGIDTNNDLTAEFVFQLPALPEGTVVDAFAINDGGDVFLLAVFPDGTEARIDPVQFASVQVVHASPGAPNVDVLANGSVTLVSDLAFPTATSTLTVEAGTYDLDVVPTGGSVGDSVLSLADTVLDGGVSYVVTAFRPVRSIAPIVYTRTTAAPAAGNVRVRAVHAADGVGEVDILAVPSGLQGTPLFSNLAEGGVTSETELPAGAYRVGIDTNNDLTAEFVFQLPALAGGTVVDAFAVNDGGDVFLLAVFPDGTEARIDPVQFADVQVVHASPDAPNVDVLANGSVTLVSNLPFPTATDTLTVEAGTYDLDVVPTGGSVGDSVLALPDTVLEGGISYVVAAFRPLARIAPIVYTRKTSAVPAGSIRVRAVHAADGVGQVDILAITGGQQGLPLFSDLDEGGVTIEAEIPAAAYRIGIDANNDLTAEFVFDLPALASGTVVDAYAINDDGDVFINAVFPDGTTARINPVPFSTVQVVHASPGAPNVDVLANGATALVSNLPFPTASNTLTVQSGTYDLDVVPAGGTVGDSVLSLPGTTLEDGVAYVVAAFRPVASISPLVYTRKTSPVSPGFIRVRAVHAADGVGEVDILAVTDGTQGLPLFADLAEGTVTVEADVPAAAYRIGLDANNDLNAEFVFDLPLLASGTVVDAYAINDGGDVFLLAVFPDGTEQRIDPVPFSRVQVVHASPDAPAVDVLANGAVALFSNQSFPGATPTIAVQSGTYDLDVVPAGGTVGDSVLSLPDTTLAPDTEYVVAAFRPLARIAPIVYTRTNTAPPAGAIRVRAVHAADGVGEVDILAVGSGNAGTPLFTDLAEGAVTAEATLPAGAYRVGIDANNDSAAEFVFDLPSLAAGTVVDAYAINDDGDVFLLAVFPDGTEARIDPTPLADVRALHLSADAPNVDIFANGALFAGDLPYLDSTAFSKVNAGATDIAIAPAGAGIGAAVLTIDDLDIAANKSTTLVAYDNVASLKALAIVENFDGLTTGSIRLNVAHTAAGVPPVDLLALGDEGTTPTVLLEDVPFGAVATLPDLPAAAYRLGLDAGPDGQIDFTFDIPELAGGTFANVFAVNDNGTVYLVAQFRDGSTAVIPPVKRTVNVADYETGQEGWTFASPSQFTAPDGTFTTGSLTLATTDNTNTFGFWESPLIEVGQTLDAIEADRLVQVTADIASSGAAANQLPVRRIRTSSESWRRSDVTVITSEGEGAYSAAGTYTHFGVLPADEDRFRISIDVLNFGATDAIASLTDIQRIETTLVSASLLGEGSPVADVDLRGQNAVGFAPYDVAPILKAPLFSVGSDGLGIAGDPADTTPGTTFGAFTAAVELPLAADTVYRINWTVTSDASDAATVPTFRLRVNDSTLQGAWYANIASTGEGQLSPAGASRTYSAYFRTPATLAGSTWLFSFDFLNTPEDGDTVTTGLTLQQLTVTSHPTP